MFIFEHPAFASQKEELSSAARRKVDDLLEKASTTDISEIETLFQKTAPYCSPYLRAEHDGEGLRIVARTVEIEGLDVLVFFRLLFKNADTGPKSSEEWDARIKTPAGKEEMEGMLTSAWDHLHATARKWRAEDQSRGIRPPLPDQMRMWLSGPGGELVGDRSEATVYESAYWADTFEKSNSESTYHGILSEHVVFGEGGRSVGGPLKVSTRDGCSMLYADLTVRHDGGEATHAIFLVAALQDESSSAVDRAVQESGLTDFFEGHQAGAVAATDLIPRSAKAYPALVVVDKQDWLAVEREDGANLALSPEEDDVLGGISTGQRKLPVYINGRAGSGKSTLLLYLFAEYVLRHMEMAGPPGSVGSAPPLFLTYSESLVKAARQNVERLLRANAQVRSRSGTPSRAELEGADLSTYFRSFQAVLLENVPREERARFEPSRHVSYGRFERLYAKARIPEARGVPAALAWHVIRGFIKGFHASEDLTPEEYASSDKADRESVSTDDYKRVYDHIYSRWYTRLLEEKGLWDDQDLVRAVLANGTARRYPVLFCDEAQDFTRAEMRLIHNLWSLGQYDLAVYDHEHLPLAFAGDELQTISPTGFREGRLTGEFHRQVIEQLPPEVSDRRLEVVPLQYNYRSAAPIVYASNLVLAWRNQLFDTGGSLQCAWFPEHQAGAWPLRFILGDTISDGDLRKFLSQDRTIIVPCEKGDEAEYVETDPFLKRVVEFDDDSGLPRNLMSAAEAKGLEQSQVVLYNFGAKLSDLLNRRDRPLALWDGAELGEDEVALEYFFNKLYVASTRATDRLIVIDTPSGDRDLWQQAEDGPVEDAGVAKASSDPSWSGEAQGGGPFVASIPKGNLKDLEAMDDPDTVADARRLLREAKEGRDPRRAYWAAQKFEGAGLTDEASESRALGALYTAEREAEPEARQEYYGTAADRFFERRDTDDALDALWEGELWGRYAREAEANNKKSSPVGRYYTARFLSSNPAEWGETSTFIESLENGETPENTEVMRLALDRLGRRLDSSSPSPKIEDLDRLARVLQSELRDLVAPGVFASLADSLAKAFFRAEKYEQAMLTYSSARLVDTDGYKIARAYLEGFPAGLEQLASLSKDKNKRTLEVWDKMAPRVENGETDLTAWAEYAGPALEKAQRFEEAFELYASAGNRPGATRLVDTAKSLPEERLPGVAQALARSGQWGNAVTLLQPRRASGLRPILLEALAETDEADEALRDEISPISRTVFEWVREEVQRTDDDPLPILLALERLGMEQKTKTEFLKAAEAEDSPHRKRFARERALAALRREAAERRRAGDDKRAAKIDEEAARLVAEWGWSENQSQPVRYAVPADISEGDTGANVPGEPTSETEEVSSVPELQPSPAGAKAQLEAEESPVPRPLPTNGEATPGPSVSLTLRHDPRGRRLVIDFHVDESPTPLGGLIVKRGKMKARDGELSWDGESFDLLMDDDTTRVTGSYRPMGSHEIKLNIPGFMGEISLHVPAYGEQLAL